jgi:hypothetical protein
MKRVNLHQMNFQFDIDFVEEEVTIILEQLVIAVAFKDDDSKFKLKRIKPDYEEHQDDLLRISEKLLEIAISN